MKLSSPIDTIKRSFEIFFEKKNMVNFVKIYLPLLPFSLFSIWQTNFIKDQSQLNNFNMIGLVVIVNLAYLVIYFWVWIAGIDAIKLILNNKEVDIKSVYKNAWSQMWLFSILSLVLFLIEVGGLILLVIPAILFGIWYSLSKFIFLEGGVGIKESLVESKNLVKGNFWKVLGRYLVFGLFTGLAGVVLSVIPYGLGGLVTTLFGALFVLPYYLLYLELK